MAYSDYDIEFDDWIDTVKHYIRQNNNSKAMQAIDDEFRDHIRNGDFTLLSSEIMSKNVQSLPLILKVYILKMLSPNKEDISQWNDYVQAVKNHCTENGHDPEVILVGIKY